MLQRQIMFKQLEELQRQKKLLELTDSRQQNGLNKQPLIQSKQASGAQYASFINGTPVRDPSQLFMFGNSNTNLVPMFPNEPPYSQAQNQILHSMSLPSQPVDGRSFGQFSHFLGPTHEYQTGIDQQEFGKGQEKDMVNASQEVTSLDPLEQKFLYNTDDENLGGLGNMLEDNDNLQGFPSVQNGTWSALMQSALEETSSTDTGVQEEWSGLSFQNPELSSDNQPSNLIENGKNPTSWQNNIFQNAQVQSVHQGLAGFPANKTPKAESTDAFTPSNSSSIPQYFRLGLSPPTQAPPVSSFDISQTSQSQQADTSHLVQLKEQDGQKSLFGSQQVSTSARQSNAWVDIPSHLNFSGVGVHNAPSGSPSTSDVANSRMKTASEVPKELGYNLLEAAGHVLNSQSFDYTKGQDGKIPSEEESLKQTHSSALNIRATVKNEKVDSEVKHPVLTTMSQLTSVSENYKSMLVPSPARESQLVKHSSHPLVQDASQLHRLSSFVQMNLASTSQYGSVWPVTGISSLAVNQDSLVSQTKKRKFPTHELLPWHKEATKGSSRLQDTSVAELDWAQAVKRVPDKLKERAEAQGESPRMFHSKKRIILTTQLMQVLLRPAPAAILSVDATTSYKTIPYFAARLALADACSLTNYSHTSRNLPDPLAGKGTISKGNGDQNLSKIVETFIERTKKLEDELLRFEDRGSVVEIRMELQELERFSVINRFAKFHSRPQMAAAAAEGASSIPRLQPQRYVSASTMPKIVPQGHNCLSL